MTAGFLVRFARALLLRDRPVYVHYAVTARCNLRCRSCVIWRRREQVAELELSEIRELAATLFRLGCAQVSLGGGEPALRPDLGEIVRTFQERGIRTRVLTNGVSLTPELARDLVGAGLREVSFSLDSLRPALQERLDGVKGTFQRRIDNLLALAEILPRRGALPILNTVVTPENLNELPRIAQLARALGFYISFIPVHLSPAAIEHRFYSQAAELRFGPADREALEAAYRELLALRRWGGRVVNSSRFLRQSPAYMISGQASWPCRAGELFMSVGPDGKVAPCHAFEGRWELDHRDLERQLGSRAHRAELRRRVASCEGCFRPCWAEVALMLQDPVSLLEMAQVQVTARLRRRRVDRAAVAALLAGEGR